MSAYTFREFEPSPAEYEAIVRVYNAANPDEPVSAKSWRHWDQHRDPEKLFTRYVVENQGEIGGYGFSLKTDPAANKFRFAVYFIPEWETAEHIDQFCTYVMEKCLVHAPASIISGVPENELEKTAWYQTHGFQPVMRYPCSVLFVNNFDPAPYTALKTNIADRGIEVVSLKELPERDPDWQKKVYELEILLGQDVPQPTTYSPPSFEQYAGREFEDPEFFPEVWLVALDGEKLVGMTSLYKGSDSIENMENGLTGVHRDYRRIGLGTLLKVWLIEIVQQLGTKRIQTWNEENNPMFYLNRKLGYEAQPADVDWEKKLI